jgi:glycosyltransferase involved in cell wall biosynthesis
MKLACVIHRFGADIAGGSEQHCRIVAERLSEHHDVTVLTTCARDHITWKNEYPEGDSLHERVHVRRFPVARTRSLQRFAEISEIAFSRTASTADEEAWFRENGPEAPGLLTFLAERGAEYDRILFWAFRYAPTFFGLPLVADRAVLVPTAEEDPVSRFELLDRFFAMPRGYIFLTPEEQALVAQRSSRPLPPSVIVGSGLEPPTAPVSRLRPAALGVSPPFVLYLGRIDPNKGCKTLIDYFLRYRSRGTTTATLVMAGPASMPIPDDPGIRPLGFVDDATRDMLLTNASLLVVPSPFESLSLVLLEAWNRALPALVNARCAVLKGQALRANGALYYQRFEQFASAMDLLLGKPDIAHQLGRQGQAYVDREYRWHVVLDKIEHLLASG